jgi:hypothetical protein
MKTLIFTAAAAAFTVLVAAPVPALAQADVEKPATVKCEWQPQAPGPRAPLSARSARRLATNATSGLAKADRNAIRPIPARPVATCGGCGRNMVRARVAGTGPRLGRRERCLLRP